MSDDDERQPDITIRRGDDCLQVNPGGLWWLRCEPNGNIWQAVQLRATYMTRGEFRAVCYGLAIEVTG
jgi:hypothetical protein